MSDIYLMHKIARPHSAEAEKNSIKLKLHEIASGQPSWIAIHSEGNYPLVCTLETAHGEWLEMQAVDVELLVLHLIKLHRAKGCSPLLLQALREVVGENGGRDER